MISALPFEPTSVRRSSNGLIAMWSRNSVVYTRVRGHFPRDHAQSLIKMVDEAISQRQPVEQFHDWGDMTGYDLSSQRDLTMWTIRVRRNVKQLTILVNSPVVEAGVKLANSSLHGMIQLCATREQFETALTTRLQGMPGPQVTL